MVNRSEAVRARIKQAREEKGLTLKQLAHAIGVSHDVTIARYESGVRQPDWDTLDRIAAATGKPLAWFFQEDAAPAPLVEAQAQAPPDTQALLGQLVHAQATLAEAVRELQSGQAETNRLLREALARGPGRPGRRGNGDDSSGLGQAAG